MEIHCIVLLLAHHSASRGREDASLCPNVCLAAILCTCENRLCYIGLCCEVSTPPPSLHFFPSQVPSIEILYYFQPDTYFADCTVYIN
jgi:hypothetical protein